MSREHPVSIQRRNRDDIFERPLRDAAFEHDEYAPPPDQVPAGPLLVGLALVAGIVTVCAAGYGLYLLAVAIWELVA